jgi:hypothetical protein
MMAAPVAQPAFLSTIALTHCSPCAGVHFRFVGHASLVWPLLPRQGQLVGRAAFASHPQLFRKTRINASPLLNLHTPGAFVEVVVVVVVATMHATSAEQLVLESSAAQWSVFQVFTPPQVANE